MELIPITESTLSPVSVKVNGEWLEIAIPRSFSALYGGNKWCYFLTSSVSGRETDAVNLNTADLPKDGSRYYGRRRPSRELKVSFYIESDSKANALLAYEHLMGMLNKDEEVKIEFADDPGRYYKAVCGGVSYSGYGRNGSSIGVIGQISFKCLNPHKYSNTVKSFTSTYDSENKVINLVVENKGTIPVPINYDVTFNKNSGYIGFASRTGAMQFGDSEETSTSSTRTIYGNGFTGQSLVDAIKDSGNKNVFDLHEYDDTTNNNLYFSERFHTKDGVFVVDPTQDKYITIDKDCLSKGVNASPSFFGAGAVIKIKQTDIPIKNFKIEFQPWFETFKDKAQLGFMQILVVNKPTNTSKPTVISGVQFDKFDSANNTAVIKCKVGYTSNGNPTVQDLHKKSYEPNYQSEFVESGPSCWFSKDKSTFKWVIGKFTKTSTISQYAKGGVNENLEATHLVIFVGNKKGATKWVGRYHISGDANSDYPRMRFNNIKITQTDSVSTTFSVDNTYKAGDKMEIDGMNGTMTVNGASRVSDEKIGSQYFMAAPGINEIQVLVSNFDGTGTTAPAEVTAKIREGWL